MADSPVPGLPDIPLLHHSYINVNVDFIHGLDGTEEDLSTPGLLPQLTAVSGTYTYASSWTSDLMLPYAHR
jgi:hypothetical protein